MPSERPAERFADVIEQSDRIAGYIKGMDFAAFVTDHRTRDAVERCLQRLSEAASKLGDRFEHDDEKAVWQSARALGNVLRHDYDKINPARLWAMITDSVPSLRLSAQRHRERLTRAKS